MLRERFGEDLKLALKAKDTARTSTLRMILAAVKDQDIGARTGEVADRSAGVSDAEILSLLTKMIKQRQESAKAFDSANRTDLADKERTEIAILQDYLPRQLDEAEVKDAIAGAISATGAASIKDMGRVMAYLRERHTGQMDFGKVGPAIKAALSA